MKYFVYLIFSVAIFLLTALHAQGNARPNGVITIGSKQFVVTIHIKPYKFPGMPADYRTRFDQTALISQVSLNGHKFLYKPFGLIDEFGITGIGVLGYKQAGIGDKFIKIGVGTLVRDINTPYDFAHAYPVANPGKIKVTRTNKSLMVQQRLSLGAWGYYYVKKYIINSKNNGLVIKYRLTNTGKKAYPIEEYNHDWFLFSNAPVSKGYKVRFGFNIDPLSKKQRTWLYQDGATLKLLRIIKKGHTYESLLPSSARSNKLTVEYMDKQRVIVKGDFNIKRFGLYVDYRAICPEVFFYKKSLKSGQTADWTRIYSFFVSAKQ